MAVMLQPRNNIIFYSARSRPEHPGAYLLQVNSKQVEYALKAKITGISDQ